MLSIRTQTAIAVLHDIVSGNDLQSAKFLFSEGEWKELFGKLEQGRLIRCNMPTPEKFYMNHSQIADW